MNHCYRLIWSAPANAWVVVSELARSKGKSSRSVARLMVVASLLGSSAFSLALDPRTLPVGLLNLMQAQQSAAQYGTMYAGLVLVMLPTLILYICVQKQLTQGMTVGGLKG